MRPGARLKRIPTRRLSLFLCFVSAFASLAASPVAAETFDWCAPVVVRPDRRYEDTKRCRPVWSPEAIAAGAEVVLVGDAFDVVDPRIDPPEAACLGPLTHRHIGAYVADLRRRATARGRTLLVSHMHRFDLVTPELAAQPGFEASFLLRTERPWSAVDAFFAADRSPDCLAGGCRLLDRAPNDLRKSLADWIDAGASEPRAHEHAVYYLVRSAPGQREYWPLAAVADLRNPAYRRWRIEEARRAIQVGGYDVVELNQKFHQYRPHAAGGGHWLGAGGSAPDVTTLNSLRDGLWTAPPAGYGYPEYVEGWAALASELRAAGVPYEVTLNAAVWGTFYDDPATPERDEARALRSAAEGARMALLFRPGPSAQDLLEKGRAELRAAGVESLSVDPGCGEGAPTPGGSGRSHSRPAP